MSNAIAATYHHRETAKILRCDPADPVSLDVSPAAICLANTLDAFVSFLQELSGCGDAYPEFTFDAACRNHADAVVMHRGGPWDERHQTTEGAV